MNLTDGICSSCGKPTKYDGSIPILCGVCREHKTMENLGFTPVIDDRVGLGFIVNATIGKPVCANSSCDGCDQLIILNDKPHCSLL